MSSIVTCEMSTGSDEKTNENHHLELSNHCSLKTASKDGPQQNISASATTKRNANNERRTQRLRQLICRTWLLKITE